MKIQLLLTGNELMTGDIIDSNSAMIADQLNIYGWRIERKVTLGDDTTWLAEEIEQMSQQADVLIINGGLGPTVDDLTADVLARVSGTELKEHPGAIDHLHQWCSERHVELNAANRKQAFLPDTADIIPNPRGSAVGIQMSINRCLVLATPGVPSELREMLNNSILPLLTRQFDIDHVQTRRLSTFGLGESGLQNRLSETFPHWPAEIELGFRASLPILEVKLTCRRAQDTALLDAWTEKIAAFLGEHMLGMGPVTLAQCTVDALLKTGQTVACAESCTGGMIASQLTSIAGASEVFHAGIVSYSNEMKQALLGVQADSLETWGAVSEEVAKEMLSGVLACSDSAIGVAVTGIAGPGGGSDAKPVGTVWIAWGTANRAQTCRLHIPFGRQLFQQWVSAACLDLIRREALGFSATPSYLERYGRH